MKRNKNIDIIRAFAILMVLIYHIYAITGIATKKNIIDTFLIYGGVVGVCIFFILSGFGIYNLLRNKEDKKEKFVYHEYLGKRFLRVAPQYYISLVVVLLLTNGAAYLSSDHLLNFISHAFFFHNLFYTLAGAISGVCWTLAVIFQFYIIAPLLYKAIQKNPFITLILSFFGSLILKYLIFHFLIAPSGQTNIFLYFNYGNQIITTLEFFVIGMFIAKIFRDKLPENSNQKLNYFLLIIGVVGLFFSLKLATITNISLLKNTGVYTDCTVAYIWHSLIAIALAIIIYSVGMIRIKTDSFLGKFLLFISDNEYGIYIWHLLIITNLSVNSPIAKNLIAYHPVMTYIFFTIISIAFGYIMNKIIDGIDYSELLLKIKEPLIKTIKAVFLVFILYCLYKTSNIIKPTIYNLNKYSNNDIVDKTPSKKIADHAEKIMGDKNNCKYIYIDTEKTGYLYFFQLRYYLAPCETIHYSTYVYTINYENKKNLYEYLKKVDVDYFLIRDNAVISKELNTEFDKKTGTIYKKNNKAKKLKDLFIKIE